MSISALDLIASAPPAVDGWQIRGLASIDERPPVPCVLTIRADGTWSATLNQFTLAGTVDLFVASAAGGHFCGPADVASSRADTYPFAMQTELIGSGPLLVAAAGEPVLELPGGDLLDGEVVE